MEGLPSNYKDNITVDNGVEIIWVNQKGQVIQQSDKSSSEKGGGAGDDGVVVGMPRVPKIRVTGGTPAGELLPASPGGTRRVSVAGTVSPAPQLIGPWFTNSPDASRPSSSGPPENEEDDADPEGHPCMALEPYAKEHHHTTRMGLLGKKRTPMETLLSWKGKQIASPLTIACRADKVMASEAVSTFGLIMGYMGDKKTKEPGMQILKSLQKRMLEGSEVFRDEVFCQVLLSVLRHCRHTCVLICASFGFAVRYECVYTKYDIFFLPFRQCAAVLMSIAKHAKQTKMICILTCTAYLVRGGT